MKVQGAGGTVVHLHFHQATLIFADLVNYWSQTPLSPLMKMKLQATVEPHYFDLSGKVKNSLK